MYKAQSSPSLIQTGSLEISSVEILGMCLERDNSSDFATQMQKKTANMPNPWHQTPHNDDFGPAFPPSKMHCLALVSHNVMKATMKKFIIANKNIPKKFRLTGTNSIMTMLEKVFKGECNIIFGPSCQSGTLGGDAELISFMCSGRLGGMLLFQDPMTSHPHQSNIDCLVCQALLHNTLMANNPTSALMMMIIFCGALKSEGKPEWMPYFSLLCRAMQ
jgi:methylglyoxal synthase